MINREKVIKGLEAHATGSGCTKNCPYWEKGKLNCSEELAADAFALLKDNEQDEGWLCEKRTSGMQITDLLCACGNKVYFTTLLFKDGFTANELYCPNCGLSMRSPHHDKEGVWLRKHWEEVVLKAQEPRVMTLEEVQNAEIVWIERAGMIVAAMKVATSNKNGMMNFAYTHDGGVFYVNIKPEYYGEKSRCWTSRPTDEQREATPWNV